MFKKIRHWWAVCLLGLLVACAIQQTNIDSKIYANEAVTSAVSVDSTSSFVQLIDEYKGKLETKMGAQVGYSGMYMPIDKPQSLLSNMVADLTYKLGEKYCQQSGLPHTVDAAIINIRGLRKAMPEGVITLGDIYEISPFENKLFIVAIYGKDLRRLFDHITRNGGEGVGNIHLVADRQTQKLKHAFIGDKALEDERLYHVISIDYLINGGDGMSAFSKNIGSVAINLKLRDALLQYVKEEYKANRPLESKLDDRISYE